MNKSVIPEDNIKSIITKYCKQMRGVDPTKSIPTIVKDLDKITYEMYRELYGLRDVRHTNYLNRFTAEDKKGHCC